MSLQINFSAHSKELTAAHQAVISDNDDTNWLIYGYDKGSNDLKVQDTGNGGLEELYDEFSDGKIQYALARVIDPNSQLPKLVFIGWCGTGVPETRKGFFNSHLSQVSKFFKTFHVQINARDEADVEPDLIMKRVSESSGANYSIHKEAQRPQPAVTPVNSVYKKTEVPDIAAMQRESMKREGPPPPVGTTYKPIQTAPKPLANRWGAATSNHDSGAAAVRAERERAEKEAREREEQAARERDAKERQRALEQEHQYNEQQAQREAEEQRQAEELQRQRQQKQQEEEEKRRQQQLEEERRIQQAQQAQQEEENRRRQQIEEENERQRQIQQAAAEEERERQRQQAAAAAAQEQERQRQHAIAEEQERKRVEQEHARQETERLQREEEERQAAIAAAAAASASAPATGASNVLSAVVLFGYDAGESNEMTLVEGEVVTEIDQVDDGWWFGISEDGKKQGLFPANYVQLLEQVPEQQQQQPVPSANVETTPSPAAPPAPTGEDLGHIAIGLYDYEAGEDNEISFHENDRITHIEFVSEEWWQGIGPDGKTLGLFPANYVELQQ
ncbi:uncharacterized protein BX664DRAFT_319644 [Halteromyces radiatus]|uniref:uncharacterized protein n=1 Tax=Halteromyces radiatus TaxID=101107 RepID=UPI002220C79A|nr:uncharacterized protein BX664DRAFT_319644 [Halteromyces radiatus]KAI8098807.1 hypothetical protein BX664DRAFT_319644 [Halteromyces radiatus]